MKKIVLLLLFVISAGATLYFRFISNSTSSVPVSPVVEKNPSEKKSLEMPPSTQKKESKSIFVPYWSLGESSLEVEEYDRLIYFGIAPSKEGINREDPGYAGLDTFIAKSSRLGPNIKKYLTIRMIDDDINFYVLENDSLQKKISEETRNILKQYSFDGLVLDLETSNILDSSITNKINIFVQKLYSGLAKDYRKFSLAIFGDTFFRKRPYDISFLGNNSDEIMIMAYDFHKSRGEPGPNFPYDSGRQYNYSFKQMLNDFTSVVSNDKLTIVYGMFGYDWSVDEKKRPISPAKALTLNEIKKGFLEKCDWKDCTIRKDEVSQETQISYIISSDTPDEQGIYRIYYHILWFEDEESSSVKRKAVSEKGINNSAYWAYGYF